MRRREKKEFFSPAVCPPVGGFTGVVATGIVSDLGPAVAGLIKCFFIKKLWKVEREESLRLTEAGEIPVEIRYCL